MASWVNRRTNKRGSCSHPNSWTSHLWRLNGLECRVLTAIFLACAHGDEQKGCAAIDGSIVSTKLDFPICQTNFLETILCFS